VLPKLSAENTLREGSADTGIQDYRDTEGLLLLREAGPRPGDTPALGLPTPRGCEQVVCSGVRTLPGMASVAPCRESAAPSSPRQRGRLAPVLAQPPNQGQHRQAPEITEDGEAPSGHFLRGRKEGKRRNHKQIPLSSRTHNHHPKDRIKIIIKHMSCDRNG